MQFLHFHIAPGNAFDTAREQKTEFINGSSNVADARNPASLSRFFFQNNSFLPLGPISPYHSVPVPFSAVKLHPNTLAHCAKDVPFGRAAKEGADANDQTVA